MFLIALMTAIDTIVSNQSLRKHYAQVFSNYLSYFQLLKETKQQDIILSLNSMFSLIELLLALKNYYFRT